MTGTSTLRRWVNRTLRRWVRNLGHFQFGHLLGHFSASSVIFSVIFVRSFFSVILSSVICSVIFFRVRSFFRSFEFGHFFELRGTLRPVGKPFWTFFEDCVPQDTWEEATGWRHPVGGLDLKPLGFYYVLGCSLPKVKEVVKWSKVHPRPIFPRLTGVDQEP